MKKLNKIIFCILFVIFNFSLFAQNYSSGSGLSASELFQLGKEEQQKENWFTACQYFLETLDENPDYADAWYALAECSYQLDEYDLTLTYLDSAEKYAKNDTKIMNLRGMTYISLGKLAEAKEVFDSILKKYPNDVNSRFGQAELFLLEGKYTAAESEYNQALYREVSNRKALLSLAVLLGQTGNFDKAQEYMNRALSFYSGDASVYYYSAILYVMQGNYKKAEERARIAVEINPSMDRAYELLANVLYRLKKYEEVINICDFRISHDRSRNTAWFLKGAAQLKNDKVEDAMLTWTNGLEALPQDEIMRSALENQINKNVGLEDPRRKEWAEYHVLNAREYARRFDTAGTAYEYQRALRIDPMNSEARLNFAKMLKLYGFNELFLEQLKFLKENSENQPLPVEIEDTIEAYDSLLIDTLSTKWKVQPFYMDKTRYKVGIFYKKSDSYTLHVDNNTTAADFASEMFTGIAETSIKTVVKDVKGFGDAYKYSRTSQLDFFLIINLDEGLRDVTLSAAVYAGRTGTHLKDFMFYNTGNDRYSSVFRRLRVNLLSMLPVRGKIINRQGKVLLIDLGKTEFVVNDCVFDVVKKGSVSTASSTSGLVYNEIDKLGTLKITNAGEDISEGILEIKGFYDKVNSDDEVVLISKPEVKTDSAENAGILETAPQADKDGQPVKEKILASEDLGIKQTPSFIDLIRGIY